MQAVEEASAGAEKAEGPFLHGAELTLEATQELNRHLQTPPGGHHRGIGRATYYPYMALYGSI